MPCVPRLCSQNAAETIFKLCYDIKMVTVVRALSGLRRGRSNLINVRSIELFLCRCIWSIILISFSHD